VRSCRDRSFSLHPYNRRANASLPPIGDACGALFWDAQSGSFFRALECGNLVSWIARCEWGIVERWEMRDASRPCGGKGRHWGVDLFATRVALPANLHLMACDSPSRIGHE
jgi:hypothetical protein